MENSAHSGKLLFFKDLVQGRCNFGAKSKAGCGKMYSVKEENTFPLG
jgi:hypothetical protein